MDIYGIIQGALNDCVNDIKRRSTQAGQVASGKTLRALEVRMKVEGERIIGEIWGRPYTGALETGSRPASKSGREIERKAMVVALAEWMQIRGLTNGLTDQQRKTAAEHLAWYIKRYGTQLYRQGGRRDIITPAIEATKKVLDDRLGLYFEQLMTTNIDNQFFTSK